MITREQDQATVRPECDVVAGSVAELRQMLRNLVGSGVRHLTIDLTDVKMVDSAGLGLLIAAHNSLQKVGGALSVVQASTDVLELFTTMRIHQHFGVCGR